MPHKDNNPAAKRIVHVAALFICVSFPVTQGSPAVAPDGPTEKTHFASAPGAFELDIPANWTVREAIDEKSYRCIMSREPIEGVESPFRVGIVIERAGDFKKAYRSEPAFADSPEKFAFRRAAAVAIGQDAGGKGIVAIVPSGLSSDQIQNAIAESKRAKGVQGVDLPVSLLTSITTVREHETVYRFEITREFRRPECMLFQIEAHVDGKKWFNTSYQVPCAERSDMEPILKAIAASLKTSMPER